jgi:hypothetical protein
MPSIAQSIVPEDALLRTFRGGARPLTWGGYGDCFSLIVDGPVSLEEFVFAFYTSPVFRIERFILRMFAGCPSTLAGARAVAAGTASQFAAWYVGERTSDQLLMCDRYERTRSWFRVVPIEKDRTLLQFGSAVAATRSRDTGTPTMGGSFKLLLGFHVWYSKILLRSAQRQLGRAKPAAKV